MCLFFQLKALKQIDKAVDLEAYIYNVILPHLKQQLEDHGHMGRESHDPETDVFIVCSGKCFVIEIAALALHCCPTPLPTALGCGGDPAKHCLDILMGNSQFANREQVTASLEYAASVNSGCDTNIDILSE